MNMKGYITNIEKETKENTDYRRVVYTAKHSQLVLMSIAPGGEIGEEVHHLDQFFRFESGQGKVVIDGIEHEVKDGDAVLVLNYEKKGVPGYIGGNTLIEAAGGFHYKKPIYILNPISNDLSFKEEILGMRPVFLNGDLNKISL